jgi:phosphoribosyl-ATP pyrophosphohydrolase/phosphoribosyl-AMP cyclohydrolase
MSEKIVQEIRWNADGLAPVITVDEFGQVLMLAWMNAESLQLSLAENRAIYWSRSRQRIWRKGEESGHIQHLLELRLDCDGDTLLMRVAQTGVACHTGQPTCFYRKWQNNAWQMDDVEKDDVLGVLSRLDRLLQARKEDDPEKSYVARLYQKGLSLILKKIGEESAELIIAAMEKNPQPLIHEMADLWFHTLVLLSHENMTHRTVLEELARRFGLSGLEEKARRSSTR